MLPNFTFIDLTHPLSSQTPTWNGRCGFVHECKLDYSDSQGEVKFRIQQLKMHAGIGTHMDAPAHCFPNEATIDQLTLDQLITNCLVIDVSGQSHATFSVEQKHIHQFEQKYGTIPQNSFVIVYTGWEKYWNHPDKYRNNHLFPNISKEAAKLLLERDIAGIGIDTLSPDRPNEGFAVHQLFLGAGKYIVENVANAHQLPPVGSYSLALPIYFTEGTEAPIRLIALVNKQNKN